MTIPNKFKSRKFWLAVVGGVGGLVTLFLGIDASEKVTQVAGAVIAVLTILGYLYAESSIDKARIENGGG